MTELVYPISYLVSLSGLIGWFYVQENKRQSRMMSKLFLGGFFAYLLSLGMAEADLSFKLLVLFRDLVVLGLVSQFFGFFRKNKVLFFGMLFALYGLIGAKGMAILQSTFPQKLNTNTDEKDTSATQLDSSGEFLVEIRSGNSIDDIQGLLASYNITSRRAFFPEQPALTDLDDFYILNIPNNEISNLNQIEQQLYQTDVVEWVEGNEVISIAPIETKLPNPIERRFGINDPGVEQLWSFDAMRVDEFYQAVNHGKIAPQQKATIAILDTGVDARHEDLADNYKSIRTKYDRDIQGHGTHCAGIAGAVSNNKIGIASLSQANEFVQITSIPVLNNFGMGTQKRIIDGILEAADNQVEVISMSLGGRAHPSKQRAYTEAVKYANQIGAIVVVAAGNSNANAKDFSPANVPGVITVSAIDEQLNRATFSNSVIDIPMGVAAPGVNIYSTFPKNGYKTLNGTSMATPYVSGLVGVLKSLNPALTTRDVFQILDESGIPTNDTRETGKLIQPAVAIQLAQEQI